MKFPMRSFRYALLVCLFALGISSLLAQDKESNYQTRSNITYCLVDGKELTLNAFLPANTTNPVPAIVDIHGGWWYTGGDKAEHLQNVGGHQIFARLGVAVFSIQYRLGKDGGFPQNIRDCRNAIRFIRKNAALFNIDPERILVTGGSAGGHLSLMTAMVPEDFDDGGATPGLEGISARVSGSFSFIAPTDFVRFWNEGPDDTVTNASGEISFRPPNDKIPNDSRPRLRVLFHGITPDTAGHKELYAHMCPIDHVGSDVPPLLICDGEKDPIVPGLEGKELYQKLKGAGGRRHILDDTGDAGGPRFSKRPRF